MAKIVTKDFEIMPIQINKAVSNLEQMPFVTNNAEFHSYMDDMLDAMIVELRSYVLAKKHVGKETCGMSISVPTTVWDHIKLDWMPLWFTRRFPVKFKTERTSVPINITYYMCPHADIKWDGAGTCMHLAFMCKPGHDEYGEPLETDGGI